VPSPPIVSLLEPGETPPSGGPEVLRTFLERLVEAAAKHGLGRIIEAGKLNKFLNKKMFDPKLQLT